MKGVFDMTQEYSQSYPFHKDKNDNLKVTLKLLIKFK